MKQIHAFAKTFDEALRIAEEQVRRTNRDNPHIVCATLTLTSVEIDLTSYADGPRTYTFEVFERVTYPG